MARRKFSAEERIRIVIEGLFRCDPEKFAAVRGSIIEAAFLARTDHPEFG